MKLFKRSPKKPENVQLVRSNSSQSIFADGSQWSVTLHERHGGEKLSLRAGDLYRDGRRVRLMPVKRKRFRKSRELHERLRKRDPLDSGDLETLMRYPDTLIPPKWRRKRRNGDPLYILFPGNGFKFRRGGNEGIPYIYFGKGDWHRGFVWIGSGWDDVKGAMIATLARQSKVKGGFMGITHAFGAIIKPLRYFRHHSIH